jgi:RNA polymerase sigma factor (sigma-70 family)
VPTERHDGSDERFREVLQRCGKRIMRGLSIPARIQSQVADEDIMQQAYFAAFSNAAQLRGSSENEICKWLSKIANNILVDVIRMLTRKKRGDGRVEDLEELLKNESKRTRGDSKTPSRLAARHERVHALSEAMNDLHAIERPYLELHYIDGLSVKEIAKRLQVGESTAYARLAGARLSLQVALVRRGITSTSGR